MELVNRLQHRTWFLSLSLILSDWEGGKDLCVYLFPDAKHPNLCRVYARFFPSILNNKRQYLYIIFSQSLMRRNLWIPGGGDHWTLLTERFGDVLENDNDHFHNQDSLVMSSVLYEKCWYVSVGGTIKFCLSKAGFITTAECVAVGDKNFTLSLARYVAVGTLSFTLYMLCM